MPPASSPESPSFNLACACWVETGESGLSGAKRRRRRRQQQQQQPLTEIKAAVSRLSAFSAAANAAVEIADLTQRYPQSIYPQITYFPPKVVRFLVKKGANVLAKNCHSRTPLEEAKKSQTKNAGIANVVAFLARHQV